MERGVFKSDLRYHAANGTWMTNRVNGICAWITTLILGFPNTANSIQTLSKVLKIANILLKWNNFYSVASFFVCT